MRKIKKWGALQHKKGGETFLSKILKKLPNCI